MSSRSQVVLDLKPILRDAVRNTEVRILSNSPYAAAIHEGYPPGAKGPSGYHLRQWAKRKLGDEKAAWGVAKMIQRHGFAAHAHGGKQKAEFFRIPIRDRGREMGVEFINDIKGGTSPQTAAGRVGEQFVNEAGMILDRNWKYTGDLAQGIFYRVQLER